MILLIGATSYVGQAFVRELQACGETFIPLSLDTLDYSRFETLFRYVRSVKPDFVINAGSDWGDWEEDCLEEARAELFQANTLLPQTIGRVCMMTNIPLGHVSSACIFNGGRVFENGELKIEADLNHPRVRRLFARQPENFLGFSEFDEPNFCFRSPPCSYNAGTKALAEEWLSGRDGIYIWRVGNPFDNFSDRSSFLSRLLSAKRVFDQFVCLSHLHDFAKACLQLVERHAPFGVYNVNNPGAITTREIVAILQRKLQPSRPFEFWRSETEYILNTAGSPRSSCILDSGKVMRAGIKLMTARAAVERALEALQAENANASEAVVRKSTEAMFSFSVPGKMCRRRVRVRGRT